MPEHNGDWGDTKFLFEMEIEFHPQLDVAKKRRHEVPGE